MTGRRPPAAWPHQRTNPQQRTPLPHPTCNTQLVSYAPTGYEQLSEIKLESQLLSPTERAAFGLGPASSWGYGARVASWEVSFIGGEMRRRCGCGWVKWMSYDAGARAVSIGLTTTLSFFPFPFSGDQHPPRGGTGDRSNRGSSSSSRGGRGGSAERPARSRRQGGRGGACAALCVVLCCAVRLGSCVWCVGSDGGVEDGLLGVSY
jgi:hypothetical protein